ncbi:MAG: 50S ribosomal protein L29 [Desulfobacterales bacterium SG8_35_2]|jgi:large subunit ribosomal protein L29|nr:MAG: 50S ribosomal protein L29 [Desulfobacterales bacterium SG8_35_2]
MKAKDLRNKLREMSEEELVAKERDLREDYFKLKFQHGVGQLENTGRLRQVRKDIARVKTARNAKNTAR